MRILLLFLGLCLGISQSAVGQIIQNEVIASSGGSFTNGLQSLDWTMGQAQTAFYSNGNSLTVGFHQNLESIVSSSNELEAKEWIDVYPNPTTGLVHVDFINNDLEVDILLLSVDGKIIRKQASTSSNNKVDLSELVSGLYFLRITSKTRSFTYKVIKTNF